MSIRVMRTTLPAMFAAGLMLGALQVPALASSKGVATGAVGGAVTGAVVGGPVGAVVGGAAGAVVGGAVTSPDGRRVVRRPCKTVTSRRSNGNGTATVTKTRSCG